MTRHVVCMFVHECELGVHDCVPECNITCRVHVCTSMELLCMSVIVHVHPWISCYMYMSMRRLCMSLCVFMHECDIYYV